MYVGGDLEERELWGTIGGNVKKLRWKTAQRFFKSHKENLHVLQQFISGLHSLKHRKQNPVEVFAHSCSQQYNFHHSQRRNKANCPCRGTY